jgi:hypothetical protein
MIVTVLVAGLMLGFYGTFRDTSQYDIQAQDLVVPQRYYRVLSNPLTHASVWHLALSVVSWVWVSTRLERRLGSRAHARLVLALWIVCPLVFSFLCGLGYLLSAFTDVYKISSLGGGPLFFSLAAFEACFAREDRRERLFLPFALILLFKLMPGESMFANLCGALVGLAFTREAALWLPDSAEQLAPLQQSFFAQWLRGEVEAVSTFSSKERRSAELRSAGEAAPLLPRAGGP